jgi:cytochrome c-type biogenesis protein CcmH
VTGFVLACVSMVAVAMAFVLMPLLRRRATVSFAVGDVNVAILRSQKREIEDEFARGAIDEGERDAALAELARRVAEEVPEGTTELRSDDDRAWPVIAVLAALLPVAAAGLYLALGSLRSLGLEPGAVPLGQPMAQMGAAPAPAEAAQAESADAIPDARIVEMVDALAKKMQDNPGDPKGWMLLARSQAALGRIPESLMAYEKAAALKPGDAQLLADYADVAVISQQGRFDGRPRELIAKALAADPNHLKALVLAASAEIKGGDLKRSIPYWERIQRLIPKESDDARQVDAILADLRAGRSPVLPGGAAAPPAQARTPPAAAGAAAPGATSAGAKVSGTIRLADDLASRVGPNDVLFVFARAKDGPRMPLAVLRTPVRAADFPKRFELTDGMAMAPGVTLSAFPEVVVEARVSRTGNAQLASGDLMGSSGVVKSSTAGLAIVIDKVAP